MTRIIKIVLFALLTLLTSLAYSQTVHVTTERKMIIDTTLHFDGQTDEAVFTAIKKWCVMKTPNYNDMLKGELSPTLIRMLKLSEYWALGGSKQSYSSDLTFEIKGSQLHITLSNLMTYIPKDGVRAVDQADKGYAGDCCLVRRQGG